MLLLLLLCLLLLLLLLIATFCIATQQPLGGSAGTLGVVANVALQHRSQRLFLVQHGFQNIHGCRGKAPTQNFWKPFQSTASFQALS